MSKYISLKSSNIATTLSVEIQQYNIHQIIMLTGNINTKFGNFPEF